jgi:amidohydrolase
VSTPLATLGVPAEVYETMVGLRRDLHRHPELSLREERTAQRIARELERLGLSYRTGVGGQGLVADVPGRSPGPMVALRADMDALPVHEETGLPFSSEVPGVMHACGHDGHASILLGAAELLVRGAPPPRPVRLIWQPAEELGTGAQAMIADGVLDGVSTIFGGHLDRRYEPGVLVVTDGPVNASTDRFKIEIRGQQGHGARPHEALDAVVVGSLLVMAIQTIVSREVDPAHPSVVSVGTFQAGTAANVIAGEAVLEGTIRAQGLQVREHLNQAIERIARSVGALHGAVVELTLLPGTPPLINTPAMAGLAREAAVEVVGPERVVPLHTANMGGEDFSYFLQHVEGCYIRYGGQIPGKEGYPAHSSRFDWDEAALAAGAAWMDRVARLAGQRLTEREA